MRQPTDKYKYCNHHHELDEDYELVNFGGGEFVANKAAIPLLKALNEAGLQTRSHHMEQLGEGWISILMDNVRFEVRKVYESSPARTQYNGKFELLIFWNNGKEGQ